VPDTLRISHFVGIFTNIWREHAKSWTAQQSSLVDGTIMCTSPAACRLGRCIEVNILLRELKRESSKWIKIEAPKLDDFSWQGGYGVFSVSPSHLELLIEYIRNQEEHHRKETYQDEFRRLCRLYGVELDERYVWD
jgi:hypothetical protein